MIKTILEQDYKRYPKASDMPAFQKYFRKVQNTSFFPLQFLYKVIFRLLKERYQGLRKSEKAYI